MKLLTLGIAVLAIAAVQTKVAEAGRKIYYAPAPSVTDPPPQSGRAVYGQEGGGPGSEGGPPQRKCQCKNSEAKKGRRYYFNERDCTSASNPVDLMLQGQTLSVPQQNDARTQEIPCEKTNQILIWEKFQKKCVSTELKVHACKDRK